MIFPMLLRHSTSHPNKLLGVLALFASILVLALLPFITASTVQSSAFRPLYRVFV